MLKRWLDVVLALISGHRTSILIIGALLTCASVWALTKLSADPSPRALLASAGGDQEEIARSFRENFGSTDNIVALMLEAEDNVYSPRSLGYMYALGQALAPLKGVERVDSLTSVPFRKPPKLDDEDELDLDSLGDEAPDPLADDPELLSALSDVVAAAPEVFPMGLATLGERTQGAQFGPLIESAQPTAEDAQAVADAVAELPMLQGRLVSSDGRYALVAVVFDDAAIVEHRDLESAVASIEKTLEEHPPPEGLRVYTSGLPIVRTTIVKHMRRDQMVLVPGTLAVSLLLLILAFRWWAGVALPLIKVALTSLWVLGGMALFGVKLNVVTNILPALLIIIGLSDSIHLITRYVQEYARTKDGRASLETTVRAIGGACLATSGTTAAGLFSLQVSKTEMLAEFGAVAGAGVLLSYVATILFLPAMLRGQVPKPKVARVLEHESPAWLDQLVSRLTLRILQRPWWVLGVSLVASAGALMAARQVRVDSALLDQFDESDPVYLTTKLLEDHFEGVRPLEVSLAATQKEQFLDPKTLKALSAVGDWARKQPGVLSVTDPSDPIEQAWTQMSGSPDSEALRTKEELKGLAYVFSKRKPDPLASFLAQDATKARVRIRLADIGSQATLAFVDDLDAQLKKRLASFSGVTWRYTGDAYVSSYGLTAVVSDLTGSLTAAVLVIFVIIIMAFRSVRYGILAVPPNALPLIFAMAWMVYRDIPLNAATAIIFSVSIGMAVDGSIHMLSRLREELGKTPLLTTAVMRAARGTGSALVIACTSLVLGFSVLLLSRFIPVQRFAELIAVSIASCLLATLVVLPALIRAVGARFLR